MRLGFNGRGLSTFKGLDEGVTLKMPTYPTLGRNEQVATGRQEKIIFMKNEQAILEGLRNG